LADFVNDTEISNHDFYAYQAFITTLSMVDMVKRPFVNMKEDLFLFWLKWLPYSLSIKQRVA